MTTYKIINLVREDFNKSVVFYNATTEQVNSYCNKLCEWLNVNNESDLYANIIKNEAGNLVLQHNMACIDMLIDDSWWSDSDLEKALNEILNKGNDK